MEERVIFSRSRSPSFCLVALADRNAFPKDCTSISLILMATLLQERQKQLESLGISLQSSGIKVGDNKCFLVNLNADPALNELLVYYLKVKINIEIFFFFFNRSRPLMLLAEVYLENSIKTAYLKRSLIFTASLKVI